MKAWNMGSSTVPTVAKCEPRRESVHDLKVELAIYRRTLIRILDWCRYQGDWRDLKPGEIAVLIEMDLKEYGK